MPLSPPFRPTASNPHSISPPIPTGPLPTLPFEIVRRIIHFRLSLSSASHPPKLGEEPEAGWDDWSGIRGRLRASKRVEERRDVTRTARGLMGVCKAWKPVVMKYLYSSPYLTENLPLLASSLVAGDSKWSDINLHQFSIPGRYITMLDLSTVSSSSSSVLHPLEFRRAIMKILPLLPNVVHLKLPAGELPFPLEEIGWAPFAKNLKCLEGVEVDCNILDSGEDALIALLRKTPNLEVLSVVGSGANSPPHDPNRTVEVPVSPRNETKLSLPNLHTLRLEDVPSSNLLSALIEAELPSLERLALTSFFGVIGDQTYFLQEAHGSKIRSLTYLQSTQKWRFDAGAANGQGQANGNGGLGFALIGMGHGLVPASDTLSLHPNLQHLAFLVPDYQQLETILSTAPIHHPLKWLTIFKWVEASANANSADDAQINGNANDHINGIIGSVQAGGVGSRDTSQFLRKILLDRQILNNGHATHYAYPRSPDLSASPSATQGQNGSPNTTTQMHNHLNLGRVNIDGFKWVKPELGKFALEAGTSGEMRKLALVLYRDGNGLELGDMDGNLAPFLGLTGGTGAGCGGGAGVGHAAIGGGMTLAGGPIDRTKGRRRSSGAGSLAGMVGMMSVSQGGSGLGQGGSPRSKRGGDDDDGG
ncbi:hypothetical protein IAU59_007097 [Kwoniella sp. CBS 9459]